MTIGAAFEGEEAQAENFGGVPMSSEVSELVDVDVGRDAILSLVQRLFQEQRAMSMRLQQMDDRQRVRDEQVTALRQENLALRQEAASRFAILCEQIERLAEQLGDCAEVLRGEVEAAHDAARVAADAACSTAERQRRPLAMVGLGYSSAEVVTLHSPA